MTVPQLYLIIKQKGRIEGRRAAVIEERFVAAAVVASSSSPCSSSAAVAEERTLPSCSLRLRRRRACCPAISVTCGSMHRCGCTVLPVGSTKTHEAVSFAVLASNRRRRRARLRLSRRRQPAELGVKHWCIKTQGLRSKKEDTSFSNLATGSGIRANERLGNCSGAHSSGFVGSDCTDHSAQSIRHGSCALSQECQESCVRLGA